MKEQSPKEAREIYFTPFQSSVLNASFFRPNFSIAIKEAYIAERNDKNRAAFADFTKIFFSLLARTAN